MAARTYGTKEANWQQFADTRIYIGDLADDGVPKSMGAGFACLHPGDVMEWVPSYDEFIVVLTGRFAVDFEGGSVRPARARWSGWSRASPSPSGPTARRS
ncbi:hypothetical protein SCALM49S_05223 [Streptomyces californicus]